MIKVAITGNIGSGKTMVCRIFETLFIPVFYADKEAKDLYDNPKVKEKVIMAFGDDVYNKNGKINKAVLASVVFSEKSALKKINEIIHPALFNKYNNWLKKHQNSIYTIHEAAVLFENHFENYFDFIIYVYAPQKLRLERVIKRDNISKEEVLKRMNHQWADDIKSKMSDFVIVNDEKSFLIPQVLKIHQNLLIKKERNE